MRVRLTQAARDDLKEIASYIAQYNPDAARRTIEVLTRRFRMIAMMPGSGRARPDIASDVNSHVAGNYTILYRAGSETLTVVRVVHGRRDLTRLSPN
jgi:toxin ParE1/3/4